MSITIREIRPDEIEPLIPLLTLAEPSERGLRWGLAHLVDTVYRMEDDGQLVGAATLRWSDEPCEIQELAITDERQGQGLGKRFVAWLINEARRRGKQRLIVGTANSSIQNIAFYRTCDTIEEAGAEMTAISAFCNVKFALMRIHGSSPLR